MLKDGILVGTIPVDREALGFGDTMMIRYYPEENMLLVEVFENDFVVSTACVVLYGDEENRRIYTNEEVLADRLIEAAASLQELSEKFEGLCSDD